MNENQSQLHQRSDRTSINWDCFTLIASHLIRHHQNYQLPPAKEMGKLTLSRHSVCCYCTKPDTISAPVIWQREKREHSQIDERMVRGCMMRARARLADSTCPIRPRADDLLHPCRSRNRPTDHLPCPGVAGGSHTLANPRAAQGEHTINGPGIEDRIG